MPATIHAFEAAGLGEAPFRVVGLETTSDRAALNAEARSAGRMYTTNLCGGACDYCGTAIFNVYRIESADGRKFKVGSDCVKKTGDAGMIRAVAAAESARRRARAERNRVEQIKAARERLPSVQEALARRPHPNSYFAQLGRTLLDYVQFHLERGNPETAARVILAE
jgi:hypothetical protein